MTPLSRHNSLREDARKLTETINKFSALRVDHTEYACLKAVVLFRAGNNNMNFIFIAGKPQLNLKMSTRK